MFRDGISATAIGWSVAVGVSGLFGVGPATGAPVKVAVIRSTGTIWNDLNMGWSAFGDVPVQIDYTSLAGDGLTLAQIEATNADVLVLSNPAFWAYTSEEMEAVKTYVEGGHGLIITYGKFRSEDRLLAPLVGLSSSIEWARGTADDPFQIHPTVSGHAIFSRVVTPYVSGVRTSARALTPPGWVFDGGAVPGELPNDVIARGPSIVALDGSAHRGIFFSYYLENKSGGTNQQDMQVFYNGLLWTARVPEPCTGALALAGLLDTTGLTPGPYVLVLTPKRANVLRGDLDFEKDVDRNFMVPAAVSEPAVIEFEIEE